MRFRRHIPRRRDWTAWLQRPIRRPEETRRRVVITLGVLIVTFALGYLVSAFAIFPAPIFARTEPIPAVVGLQHEEAQTVLRELGFGVGESEPISHPSAANGVVVWQDPPAGVAARLGSSIALAWSRGPQRVPVPDVSGYEQGLARRLIGAAGLRIGRSDTTQSPVPRGVVINSRPPAGTTLLPGSSVTLVISVGAPTISVPDLIGMTEEEALTALAQVGLILGDVRTMTSNAGPAGTVFRQEPAAGTLSASGAAVVVTLVRGNDR